MRARALLAATVALSTAALGVSVAAAHQRGTTARPTGLPAGAPPAAHASRADRSRRHTAGPSAEAFPRTSGTGRSAGGATYWTDFLYDDHGALGTEVAPPASGLAPTIGTYVYPAGPANGNGADIFRAAVGLTR